jgi:hypothetical protein
MTAGVDRGTLAMLMIAAVLLAACATRPAPPPLVGAAASLPPTSFVIPTDLGSGRVEVTVLSVYPYGQPVRVPVTVRTSRGTISGPMKARVVANGFGENGAPSEVLVRELSVRPVSVAAGQRGATEIVWDGLDEAGALVPADMYSLVLEFSIDDGYQTRRGIGGATLQFGR